MNQTRNFIFNYSKYKLELENKIKALESQIQIEGKLDSLLYHGYFSGDLRIFKDYYLQIKNDLKKLEIRYLFAKAELRMERSKIYDRTY